MYVAATRAEALMAPLLAEHDATITAAQAEVSARTIAVTAAETMLAAHAAGLAQAAAALAALALSRCCQ
jgi:hypothetical protein